MIRISGYELISILSTKLNFNSYYSVFRFSFPPHHLTHTPFHVLIQAKNPKGIGDVKMSNSNKDQNKDENARVLFQTYIDDIRFSKRQQWYVMYLTLLAIAGILSLSLKVLCDHTVLGCLLTLLGLVIPVLGLYMIRQYNYDIERYRNRKNILKEELEGMLRDKVQKRLKELKQKEEKDIDWVFRLVIFLALLLTLAFYISIWFSCPDCP